MSVSSIPVQAPADAEALAGLLAQAHRDRAPIAIRGGGTKSGWWSEPAPPVLSVSTRRLAGAIDHCAGDLTATIDAGTTLADANAVLARAGQWLPLDPPGRGATIGGIVAANDSGPRRHRHGTPRDLIIGIEMVRADGTRARAGGKVVKNVAGYDLARMLCGSLGSLGVVTGATFKLAPLAPASRTVIATARDGRACAALALAVGASPAAPAAIEIESPPHRVLIRFETTEGAAEAQAAATAALCRERGAEAAIVAGEPERSAWSDYERRVWPAVDALVVKVSVLPTEVGDLLDAGQAPAAGRGALGVVFLRADIPSAAAAGWLDDLRTRVSRRGGSAVVVRAPSALQDRIDIWGPLAGSRSLMRAVKARLDPHGILNPGRGPGGL